MMKRIIFALFAFVATLIVSQAASAADGGLTISGKYAPGTVQPCALVQSNTICDPFGTFNKSTGEFIPNDPNIAYLAGVPGIICDGIADANVGGALQTFVNAAAAAKHRVNWPKNAECRLKTAFIVPSNADWEGFNTTISLAASIGTIGTLGPVGMSLENASNIRWKGLTFNGPGSASINSNARIVGGTVSDITILDSTFQNFGNHEFFTGTVTAGSAHYYWSVECCRGEGWPSINWTFGWHPIRDNGYGCRHNHNHHVQSGDGARDWMDRGKLLWPGSRHIYSEPDFY
jgi:hypothetical protein